MSLLQICTTLCVHSLYSYWKDEKSVVRSLQELSQGHNGHHGGLIGSEFEKVKSSLPSSSYYNAGFHHHHGGSQHHLNSLSSMAITKYSGELKGGGGLMGGGGAKSLLKR